MTCADAKFTILTLYEVLSNFDDNIFVREFRFNLGRLLGGLEKDNDVRNVAVEDIANFLAALQEMIPSAPDTLIKTAGEPDKIKKKKIWNPACAIIEAIHHLFTTLTTMTTMTFRNFAAEMTEVYPPFAEMDIFSGTLPTLHELDKQPDKKAWNCAWPVVEQKDSAFNLRINTLRTLEMKKLRKVCILGPVEWRVWMAKKTDGVRWRSMKQMFGTCMSTLGGYNNKLFMLHARSDLFWVIEPERKNEFALVHFSFKNNVLTVYGTANERILGTIHSELKEFLSSYVFFCDRRFDVMPIDRKRMEVTAVVFSPKSMDKSTVLKYLYVLSTETGDVNDDRKWKEIYDSMPRFGTSARKMPVKHEEFPTLWHFCNSNTYYPSILVDNSPRKYTAVKLDPSLFLQQVYNITNVKEDAKPTRWLNITFPDVSFAIVAIDMVFSIFDTINISLGQRDKHGVVVHFSNLIEDRLGEVKVAVYALIKLFGVFNEELFVFNEGKPSPVTDKRVEREEKKGDVLQFGEIKGLLASLQDHLSLFKAGINKGSEWKTITGLLVELHDKLNGVDSEQVNSDTKVSGLVKVIYEIFTKEASNIDSIHKFMFVKKDNHYYLKRAHTWAEVKTAIDTFATTKWRSKEPNQTTIKTQLTSLEDMLKATPLGELSDAELTRLLGLVANYTSLKAYLDAAEARQKTITESVQRVVLKLGSARKGKPSVSSSTSSSIPPATTASVPTTAPTVPTITVPAITAVKTVEKEYCGTKLIMKMGSILEEKVDFLVNPANTSLQPFGELDGELYLLPGLCGQIYMQAGEEPFDQAKTMYKEGVQPGEAVITKAGKLKGVQFIIHAVGPTGDDEKRIERLKSVYVNALVQAATTYIPGGRNDFKTIAFPPLSTGTFTMLPAEAAPVSLQAVGEFLRKHKDQKFFKEIIFMFSEKDADKKVMQVYVDAFEKNLFMSPEERSGATKRAETSVPPTATTTTATPKTIDRNYHGTRITVKFGDIFDERVDFLVNPANASLGPGAGLCGQIFDKAGMEPFTEAQKMKKDGIQPGEAIVTKAGTLKSAHFIVHAVGPTGKDGDRIERLKSAYKNALSQAANTQIPNRVELNLKTIAFPAISTGIFAMEESEAAPTSLQAVGEFIRENRKGIFQEIIFIFNDNLKMRIYAKELERRVFMTAEERKNDIGL